MMDEGRLTEKELCDELRIARVASLVALGVSLINIAVIMFFSLMVLGGGVVK